MAVFLKKPVLVNPLTSFRVVERTPGRFEAWFELYSEDSEGGYVGMTFAHPDDLLSMADLFYEAAHDLAVAPTEGLVGETHDDVNLTTGDIDFLQEDE